MRQLLAALLLIGLLAPVTQAADKPGYITVEPGAACDTTIIRFGVLPGVEADVTITSTLAGAYGTVFDEHVNTVGRSIPLEVLSISGQLGDGVVVMTIDQFRFRERIRSTEC